MGGKVRNAGAAAAPTDRSGDRRQHILAAASRRFAAHGYEATTVRQIADDVDLLAGSLYHHFANKEAMLHAIVRDTIVRMRDRARDILRRPADPERQLVALIFADADEMTSAQEVHAILHQERAFFRRSADFQYVVDARRDHYITWRTIFEQGIAQGLFGPNINVYLTISTVIRMLNTGADWYVHKDRATVDLAGIMSLDELSAFYATFVLNAVRAPDRVRAPIPWPDDTGADMVAGEPVRPEALG